MIKILFLDQSGKLGGAELSLMDVAEPYKANCLVGLFADGAFREALEKRQIPVQVFTNQAIQVQKSGSLLQGLRSLGAVVPLVKQVAQVAQHYDLLYANTQKALVVGALASLLSQRPLVYHLRDILSSDHFSFTNRKIAVTLANQFASLVIANSQATQAAFVAAGGRTDRVQVVYNGFNPQNYQVSAEVIDRLKQELALQGKFVVGHFSRLSPWKGQDILIRTMAQCSEQVVALLVGDALFGEDDYIAQLKHLTVELGLEERVKFLGFRSDIPQLMTVCNLIAHTSTAPEPFGRVIVEAMLCNRPVVAAQAGGAIELVESEKTGWLTPPGDADNLAEVIQFCYTHPEQAQAIADRGYQRACQQFNLDTMNQQLQQLLAHVVPK
ncbi:MAG: glycosyltransferase family 4 protein [Elainellaceae cyanobacterium]